MITTIRPDELNDMQQTAVMVDVRTPAEYEEIHIPGSRLIPLHQLDKERIGELNTNGDTLCLLCSSGTRAHRGAEKLIEAGLKNVVVLEGGVEGWDGAGLPVKRGRKTMSIERQTRIGAGLMVLAGVVLGVVVNPLFLILSGFVGCGLIVAGVTDWCGMGLILTRMPWNNRGGEAACCGGSGGGCCS
jgi:rhodanese-related sulfurtransferase